MGWLNILNCLHSCLFPGKKDDINLYWQRKESQLFPVFFCARTVSCRCTCRWRKDRSLLKVAQVPAQHVYHLKACLVWCSMNEASCNIQQTGEKVGEAVTAQRLCVCVCVSADWVLSQLAGGSTHLETQLGGNSRNCRRDSYALLHRQTPALAQHGCIPYWSYSLHKKKNTHTHTHTGTHTLRTCLMHGHFIWTFTSSVRRSHALTHFHTLCTGRPPGTAW